MIGDILDALQNGKTVLIGYASDKTQTGHTVLAYSLSELDREFSLPDGSIFRAAYRLNLYDPDAPVDGVSDLEAERQRYDIYLNQEKTLWYIPIQRIGNSVPDTKYRLRWAFSSDDIDLFFQHSAFSEPVTSPRTKAQPNAYMTIISDVDVEPFRSDNGTIIYSGSGDDSIVSIPNCWGGSEPETEKSNAYCMYLAKSNYTVDFETKLGSNEKMFTSAGIEMEYPDSLYQITSKALNKAEFSPKYMKISAEAKSAYTLLGIRNETTRADDFYKVGIDGTNGSEIQLTECPEGWILESDTGLEMLSISAKGTNGVSSRTIATGATHILIASGKSGIEIRLDLVGNGSYEKSFDSLSAKDITKDGSISLADAVAAFRCLSEDKTCAYHANAADLTGDGYFTLQDAAVILKLLR